MIRHKLTLLFLTIFSVYSIHAQTKVTIDFQCQRYIGDVSTLDRTKYFTMHDLGSDPDIQQFMQEYNVSPGRSFWGPFSYANSKTGEVGVYPTPKTGTSEVRPVKKGLVATEHPKSVVRYNLSTEEAGKWAVEYYKNFVDGERPAFFEPMNEPFVHAGDDVFNDQQPDAQLMRVRMAEWFGEVGKAFDNSPELADMKVIGYSSAWPSMELYDFKHWEDRQKMFMDKAGQYMDAFAVHLYDGLNVTGQDNQRSGSNSEAILDLIETYSYTKWGEIKPHAITEYGLIEKGFPAEYSDLKFIQAIKGQNHLVFGLLDREDRLAISIPFTTGKAQWHITEANNYEPYGATLFRPVNVTPTSNPNKPNIGGWEYTSRINFYKLWKEVKGNRVRVHSSDPDVFVQAFLEGNHAYIGLNNIETNTKTVALDFLNSLSNVKSVTIKKLKIFLDKSPIYEEYTQTTLPETLDLLEGETVMFEIEMESSPVFTNAIRSQKYYTSKHLQTIVANQTYSFQFNGVALGTGQGEAILRMGIGRKHNKSKAPIVKVNGTIVTVPTDWKGYDQANRDDFFGTIEIPVSMELIQENNTITIQFPDSDGRISSLILDIAQFDNEVTQEKEETISLLETNYVFNEGTTDLSFEVNYAANEQREIFVEIRSPEGTWLGGKANIVEANENSTTVTISLVSAPPVGENYQINAHIPPVGTNWQSLIQAIQATAEIYSPYVSIPGTVQTEAYENQMGIQVENTSDGNNEQTIGYIKNGDWSEYLVDVVSTGYYQATVRAATTTAGGQVEIFIDDVNVGNISVTNTAGWQAYQDFLVDVTLESGQHTLKLNYTGNTGYLFNVNWISFTQKEDCNGDLSNAYLDECGVCVGGLTSKTATTPQTWYEDVDGDGTGEFTSTLENCEQPQGYVATYGDNCPNDINKIEAGECGCGVAEGTCDNPVLSIAIPTEEKEMIQANPNPFLESFIINFPVGTTALKVYDLIGNLLLVKEIDSNSTQEDVSMIDASPGTYVIELFTTSSKKTLKIVKF